MGRNNGVGAKIRTLRRQHRMTQTELARRLGVSPSYVNLIEHNRRTFNVDLLLKLADILPVDLKLLTNSSNRVAELVEVFGDPLFENTDVMIEDVHELAAAYPSAAQVIIQLYEAFTRTRKSAQDLAEQMSKETLLDPGWSSRFPSEEVSDLFQLEMNYFPELEAGAEQLRRVARLDQESVFSGLVKYLNQHVGAELLIEPTDRMNGAVHRFDPNRKVLSLWEGLRRGRRNFRIAYQIGLLTQNHIIDRIVANPLLTTGESRVTCRVALANYFAAAVLMPYQEFLDAAGKVRYDIELLGNRFDTSFEQTCHRIATLRRPDAEGIPIHFIRVDIAGNMSKRFSASSLRIPRFGGACPRWNTFGAFLTPGIIRTQISQMPDGQLFFGVARTVWEESSGYTLSRPQYAIGIGCDLSYAQGMVYSDGLNLVSPSGVVPVGPSCRLCERTNCEQRACPPLLHPIHVDQNRHGIAFYAPPPQ